jgi:hypothetical protein
VEYLRDLATRAGLAGWNSWGTQYRVLAVVVGLLLAYWAIRALLPAMLRLLWPALFLAVVLVAVWALFPAETCSLELLARLPVLCAR